MEEALRGDPGPYRSVGHHYLAEVAYVQEQANWCLTWAVIYCREGAHLGPLGEDALSWAQAARRYSLETYACVRDRTVWQLRRLGFTVTRRGVSL